MMLLYFINLHKVAIRATEKLEWKPRFRQLQGFRGKKGVRWGCSTKIEENYPKRRVTEATFHSDQPE